MAKQLTCQRFIYKIHSQRLRESRWNLSLPLPEARMNEEVISLADSQILRWIDELNGRTDVDSKAAQIKNEIKALKQDENSYQSKKKIRELYSRLDEVQFYSDYMCLIIDRISDYWKACKGFTINGIRYKRLLGTNGGIKNSTIVFVSERLWQELHNRIECDRNPDMKLVTAKLEAYKALVCSASIPVSLPKGILVVNDCYTRFHEDVYYAEDDPESPEPKLSVLKDYEIELDASDGFGLMSPELAARWSEELHLDYTVAGLNSRFSFEKGMLYTFDFKQFAKEIAKQDIVIDAWGNPVNIQDVEVILTTSMVKLWDSYESCEDYIAKSTQNGYTFAVTKTTPAVLESERNLNYQYLQSYDLTDEEIEELIAPTMNEIREVMSGDWKKTVLFLKGIGLNERNILKQPDDVAKAIMVDTRMINDPYVVSYIWRLIRNRINEAKTGVIKVHGNYSIASGDPYALCQSMFGMEVTGLLKAGEVYNHYWKNSPEVLCFRSPMTWHGNIVKMRPAHSEEIDYWYQYMNTCTIFNAWDSAMSRLNGMDFDGDLVMLTDNEVLLKKHVTYPALMCAQNKAEKKVSSELDFVQSNIDSFGNDIGAITNRITTMFEVQSHFGKNSNEFKVLDYRIKSGQKIQQDAIDKAKGIICKPMPKYWYNRHDIQRLTSGEDKEFQKRIMADRKPYFFRYIYPELNREYLDYIRNVDRNCQIRNGMSFDRLRATVYSDLTDEQKQFLDYARLLFPVGMGPCVMNRICWRFEEEFDHYLSKTLKDTVFDYSLMRAETEYDPKSYYSIRQMFTTYNRRLQRLANLKTTRRIDKDELTFRSLELREQFVRNCEEVCPNESQLCNILLDLCYKKSGTKKFVWSACPNQIIENLLNKNHRKISFPTKTENGSIRYGGFTFEVETKEVRKGDEDLGHYS